MEKSGECFIGSKLFCRDMLMSVMKDEGDRRANEAACAQA